MTKLLPGLVLCAAALGAGCSTAPGTLGEKTAAGTSATSAPVAVSPGGASADPPGVKASASANDEPPLPPPDAALLTRLRADVEAVAISRAPLSPGWRSVQAKLKERLNALGIATSTQAFGGGGQNVLGIIEGTDKESGTVILSAHYDHIAGCGGADDNASGVAVVLEAARALSASKSKRTLVLAFWDQEEAGLLGSAEYARVARARGDEITLMISLDGVGYADRRAGSQTLPDGIDLILPEMVKELEATGRKGDFLAAIGDEGSSEAIAALRRQGARRGLPVFGAGLSRLARLGLLDAARSDHASFWLAGYPGILLTDTANFRNPRYHCGAGPDTPETLDYEFLARVTLTTIDLVREVQGS